MDERAVGPRGSEEKQTLHRCGNPLLQRGTADLSQLVEVLDSDRNCGSLFLQLLQPQLHGNLVQIRPDQGGDVTYSDVIISVERLENFGRAATARYVDYLVCGDLASRRQLFAVRFQPNLRLAMINLPRK